MIKNTLQVYVKSIFPFILNFFVLKRWSSWFSYRQLKFFRVDVAFIFKWLSASVDLRFKLNSSTSLRSSQRSHNKKKKKCSSPRFYSFSSFLPYFNLLMLSSFGRHRRKKEFWEICVIVFCFQRTRPCVFKQSVKSHFHRR